MQQLPLGVRWRDSSVFATFVHGANTLVVRSLESQSATAAPVTWLWGSAGSGKSHLLQAACALAGERGQRAAYFPMRERAGWPDDAFAGCEELAIVCVDDADAIAGEPRWNRALFNLHNGLLEQRGRLLLSGAQPPAAIGWALADLASRMAASLVLHLAPLAESDQIEVLRLRAKRRGLELPEDVAQYLLRRVPRDLRSLCALLDTLDAASLAKQRRLTVPFIRQILGSG